MPNLSKTFSDNEAELSSCRSFPPGNCRSEDTRSSRGKGLADWRALPQDPKYQPSPAPHQSQEQPEATSPACQQQGHGMTGKHRHFHWRHKGQLWGSSSALWASLPSSPKKTDARLLSCFRRGKEQPGRDFDPCHNYSSVPEQHTFLMIPSWN